ncbi:hypothetical protein BD560DRAFT_364711 [Blakeslea trispora]|nr:hypothetical protein BD560DRAFT_364711 [Blakeslea trispora]
MRLVYSNIYKHSQYQSKISPNDEYVANAIGDRIVIRKKDRDLSVIQVYETRIPIHYIQWSPNSEYIMAVNYEKSRIYIRSVVDYKWQGSITERRFPIVRVNWSPDSKNILCMSELNLRLAVWNLSKREMKYMNHLKYTDKCIEFSPDGQFVAIVELNEGKEYIGIYHANSFILLQRFEAETVDLENLKWSPNSMFIAVWDNCIYHRVLVYRQDGQLYKSYSGYDFGLGVKSVNWSPNSPMMAIGNYDETIHLLSTLSWDVIAKLEHPAKIHANSNIIAIEEVETPNLSQSSTENNISYHTLKPPFRVPKRQPSYNEPNPKMGISSCQFSPQGLHFYSKSDSMPTILWMWDVRSLTCTHMIKFRKNIKQALWHPQQESLLLVTCGDGNLHLVQHLSGDIQIHTATVPTKDFSVKKIKWSPNGNAILLLDQELFCLAVDD